jgi:hypothetical protein
MAARAVHPGPGSSCAEMTWLPTEGTTKVKCEFDTGKCTETGVAIAVETACPGCGREKRWSVCCARHQASIRKNGIRCGRCKHHLADAPPVMSFYEGMRQRFEETGFIAHKDAMVEQVTLREPPGWDIWGSLVPREEPPARTRLTRSQIATLTYGAVLLVTMVLFVLQVLGVVKL